MKYANSTTQKEKYYVLSTDTKITNPILPIGSEIEEVDTGRTYVSDGTNWIIKPNESIQYTITPITNVALNVASQITRAGVPNKSWYITYGNWRVSGSAPVGTSNMAVTIKDGSTIIYQSAIPANSVNGTNLSLSFPQPIKISTGSSFSFDIVSPNNVGSIIYSNMGVFNL